MAAVILCNKNSNFQFSHSLHSIPDMQIPPITRNSFLGTAMTMCFQSLFNPQANENAVNNSPLPALCSSYHQPPPGTDYKDNPLVFGKILRGDIPCRTYKESEELFAFQDRTPKAPFHALVIPKDYIQNVYSLTSENKQLVQDMREMGLHLLKNELCNDLVEKEDYILCFHIPPFNSVDHLHLHVLAPASEMEWVYKYGKYNCSTRWCTSDLEVIDRLKDGKEAVPYKQISF